MSLNYDKLVKFVKANPEASQKAAADSQGLTIGEVSMLKFCQAKVEAGVVAKSGGTPKQIKTLRDNGARWELIAAQTGKSVGDVKSAYEEAGGDASTSYTGRGRNPNGATATKAPAKKSAAKAKTGAAAKKAAPKGRPAIVRNRRGRAANPS